YPIIYPQPKADFDFSNSCLVDSVHFTDKTTLKSGTITGWRWDFGDGGKSNDQNPVHLFNAPGAYSVRLVAITHFRCYDTVIKKVTIYPMPVAGFRKTNVCYGNAITFTDTSKVSSGSIADWFWDFGDGNSSTQQSPAHAFTKPATYKIKH